MDSHTISAPRRLEVVEMGRRRRWSDEEKLRIVLESLSGPRLVSITARRHRISRSLLVIWRRVFLAEQRRAGSVPGFVPAMIVPETTQASSLQAKRYPEPARSCEGRIEIVLASGRRIVIDAGVDPEALARVLNVVDRQ
jgi:transposase